jgi:FkbM family methyltransferase
VPNLPTSPGLFQRLAASIERRAQKAQGKGSGGHSVAEEVRAALPFLPQQGAVVLDVGANKGLWSRTMLAEAGERLARLVAVEPSRHNWLEIEAIADPRFSLIRKALSESDGTATLHMDAPGSGLASLTQRNLTHVGLAMEESEAIETVRLDTLLAELGLERIDFMKLDIEGHELSALQGGEKALAEGRIRALSFEFGGSNIDTRTFFRDFWLLLHGHGYALLRIVPGGSPVPIQRYHERLESFVTTNYLAILR